MWNRAVSCLGHKRRGGAGNGLFNLTRVPPMDDFLVSVPGVIDMLGYVLSISVNSP